MNYSTLCTRALILMICVVGGAPQVFALEKPCGGDIVGPDSPNPFHSEGRSPILDCEDPFNGTIHPPSPYTLTLYDTVVQDGDVVETQPSPAQFFEVTGRPQFPNNNRTLYLFKHVANDYVYVEQEGFGEYRLNRGEYTLIIYETELILSQHWLDTVVDRVRAAVIPIAYAQEDTSRRYVITFEIIGEDPPLPASNILFIPGVLGSRLYEDIDACANASGETELWVSFSECAQRRLTTNFIGQSDNDVYTRPDAVVDEILSFNIYKTFLQELTTMQNDNRITAYATFPYDWRRGLDVIVTSRYDDRTERIRAGAGRVDDSYLYELVLQLSQTAPNGKVTIVAHSNGGLVAKHFLALLQESGDPLVEVIDNLILVAVPQTGTPDAILGALHGADLGGGIVMTNETSRLLLNNFPVAYHLLPHQGYFERVDTPVITFEPGVATDAWRSQFGAEIDTITELHTFLGAGSGRVAPRVDDLDTPEVLHTELLGYARTMDIIQHAWTPPETLTVTQIAGTGLRTPATLVYASGEECIARTLGVCTERGPKTLLRADFVFDGDGTVVTPSALLLPESDTVKRMWVDFDSYNANTLVSRKHKDILEIEDVIRFIRNTALNSTTPYTYLQETPPVITRQERLNFTLHSPLDIQLQTGEGVVSSTTVTLKDASYHRYGETTFISIPKDTLNPALSLRGYREGSFSLDIDEERDGVVERRNTYAAIPSGVDTLVTLNLVSENPSQSTLLLDYEADGVVDVTYATTGPVVIDDKVTYEDLYDAIYTLNLKRAVEKVLINVAKKAERFHSTYVGTGKHHTFEVLYLTLLKKHLLILSKVHIITYEHYTLVSEVIDELLK